MQHNLGTVVLKSGERVEAAVIAAPDTAWAERLKGFLAHKGEPWNWGNAENLTKLTGVETFFYIMHRDGVPFSNIMTCEVNGVGHFGHVFTRPEDRRKGACDKLMALQMEHFRARGGRALFLGTGFASPAYRLMLDMDFRGSRTRAATWSTTPPRVKSSKLPGLRERLLKWNLWLWRIGPFWRPCWPVASRVRLGALASASSGAVPGKVIS